MLDEWTSRLLWLDPNDNELALRFHYDTLFINNIQTIRRQPLSLFTVRAEARTTGTGVISALVVLEMALRAVLSNNKK